MDTGALVTLALAPLAVLAVASAFGLNLGFGILGDVFSGIFSGDGDSDGDGGGDGGGD
jgi:hypothetical protein